MNDFTYGLLMAIFFAVNIGVGSYQAMEGRSAGAMNFAAAAFIALLALIMAIRLR